MVHVLLADGVSARGVLLYPQCYLSAPVEGWDLGWGMRLGFWCDFPRLQVLKPGPGLAVGGVRLLTELPVGAGPRQ